MTRRPTPARDAESDANKNADTDGKSDDDNDDEPRGDHDGRFHDDDSRSSDDGTEPAEAVDAPRPLDAWAADEVDDAALARAHRLAVTLVPSHDPQTTTHTFRLRDDTPGHLFVKIGRGVPAPGGYRLRDDYANVLDIPVPDKEITHPGRGRRARAQRRKETLRGNRAASRRSATKSRACPPPQINHLASQTNGQLPEARSSLSRHFNEQDLARITAETQDHQPAQSRRGKLFGRSISPRTFARRCRRRVSTGRACSSSPPAAGTRKRISTCKQRIGNEPFRARNRPRPVGQTRR